MDVVFEIFRIILPAAAVFVAVYLVIRSFLDNEKDKRHHDRKIQIQQNIIPLKLQAYERLVIFLERIHPNVHIIRVNKANYNCHQLHQELIKSIKSEYEHNLSQQIYVSKGAWELVKNAKEELIKLINLSFAKVNPDAPAQELAMIILNAVASSTKKLPNEIAIEYIKKEVAETFG
ncbi:MAG: hypothetical protein N3F09_06790 [Bacteroidia bacterium]|nr:hypothetical protein [Bacteroidia bacterium]